eukprot:6999026-Prymnesium_polylepis.1
MPLVDESAAERRAARARGPPPFGEDTRHGHATQAGGGAGRSEHGVEALRSDKKQSASFFGSDFWNLA